MGRPTAAPVGHTRHIVTATGYRVWLNTVPGQQCTRDMCSASDENGLSRQTLAGRSITRDRNTDGQGVWRTANGTGNKSLKNKIRGPFSRELNFDQALVEIKQMYDNTACITNCQC
jgi:hypothetical protein